MLAYWLMYLIPVSMALFIGRKQQAKLMPWVLIGLLFIILIGLRYDVGGDGSNYMLHYDNMYGLSLKDAVSYSDPGHQFLNWLSYRWDWGVYGTNVVYGIIFMVVLGYTLVLFVWLNFAVHSHDWIPYQNLIFKELF